MVQSENRNLYIDFKDTYLFDELFRQNSKPLFYFAAKFVEDEVAKDIVQDVFVKLWSGHEIIISKSLNALLFTMVKNSCLQQKLMYIYIPFNPSTDEYPYPPDAAEITFDGLHPSDKGNIVIADRLVRILKEFKFQNDAIK